MNGENHKNISTSFNDLPPSSKIKSTKHGLNSPKLPPHEKTPPAISYPKIPLSEVFLKKKKLFFLIFFLKIKLLNNSKSHINSHLSIKKLMIHSLKRFENLNLKLEDRQKVSFFFENK